MEELERKAREIYEKHFPKRRHIGWDEHLEREHSLNQWKIGELHGELFRDQHVQTILDRDGEHMLIYLKVPGDPWQFFKHVAENHKEYGFLITRGDVSTLSMDLMHREGEPVQLIASVSPEHKHHTIVVYVPRDSAESLAKKIVALAKLIRGYNPS